MENESSPVKYAKARFLILGDPTANAWTADRDRENVGVLYNSGNRHQNMHAAGGFHPIGGRVGPSQTSLDL